MFIKKGEKCDFLLPSFSVTNPPDSGRHFPGVTVSLQGGSRMNQDTIAAIATGLTASGISIIRISGPDAFSVASKIFQSGGKAVDVSSFPSHTVHYGYIADGQAVIDEVMLLVMRAPRTFTREDTVEIDCHGGIVVTKKVLDTVLRNGARLAGPGEFTKRAFLNGRIDLSQAEAVMELIESKNERALRNSLRQLRGGTRERITELRKQILTDVATIEASLDQPEYYSLEGFAESLSGSVQKEREEIAEMIKSADNGRLIKEGIRTVILGRPNVGKSSLMNALLREDRAIVTEIAGTTRDTLSEEIRLNGITLIVTDTAGIRNTADPVEQIGVKKAHEQAGEADLILYVADASAPLSDGDREILSSYRGKKMLAVLNKTDLEQVTKEEQVKALLTECGFDAPVVPVSVKEGTGLAELEQTIADMFFAGELDNDAEAAITSERQKECLKEAYDSLGKVLDSLSAGLPEDFLSIDLMGAYEALSRIIGEEVDEDLIDRIFEQFCLGK